MKKILLIISIVFSLSSLYAETNLIKRTIVVAPVVNNTLDEKNDSICIAIRDLIRAELIMKEQFYFINYSTIDALLGNKKINDIYDALNFAVFAGGDVIIVSQLTIENNELTLNGSVIDAFTGTEKISFNISAEKGVKDIEFIKRTTRDIAKAVKDNFPMISEETINEISKNQTLVIEEEDPEIISRLLEQKDKYRKMEIKRGKEKRTLAIPFGKNVLIFVSEKKDDFIVEYNGIKYKSKKGVKIMAFDSEIKTKREFTIYDIDKKPVKYIYVQKNEFEVSVKTLDESYKGIFVESGIDITSLLYMGINLKVGLNLPLDNNFKNTLYFRTFFGTNLNINYTGYLPLEKNKNINPKDIFQNPNLKLKLGLGYEHIFSFNKIALHVGGEIGTELHWSNILINSIYMIKIDTDWGLYHPSIYISGPFGVELLADKKVSLILGIEPVVRFRFNIYSYKGDIYTDEIIDKKTDSNYEATRGFGWDMWKGLRGDIVTFELFIYDMPVTVAARFKF